MKTLKVKRVLFETAEIELSDEEYEKYLNGDIDFNIFDIIGETYFSYPPDNELAGEIIDPDTGKIIQEWQN